MSTSPAVTFSSFSLHPDLMGVLERKRMTEPTPIQAQAIPVALTGKDVIGIAQTGTGKTLAFGLPVIQRCLDHKGKVVILLPTRELAFQVEESLKPFANKLNIQTVCLIGGAPIGGQKQALKRMPRIIIATPGRLIDHLEQKTVTLRDVHALILDEADRMFDMGFAPQIQQIVKQINDDRQTLLFSATMPGPIAKLAAHHMVNPTRIEIATAGTVAEKVEQGMYIVGRRQKNALLDSLLAEGWGTVLVFIRTKHSAKTLTQTLKRLGHSAAEIHSNRSLSQRRQALEGFKTGKHRVLVATDIAARGIDVAGIELVVNFDLPENPEDYVHRIGRTARAGMTGKAYSFALPEQRDDVRRIERLIRMQIPQRPLPTLADLPSFENHPSDSSSDERPWGKSARGGSRGGSRGGFSSRREGGSSSGGERSYSSSSYSRSDDAPASEGGEKAPRSPFRRSVGAGAGRPASGDRPFRSSSSREGATPYRSGGSSRGGSFDRASGGERSAYPRRPYHEGSGSEGTGRAQTWTRSGGSSHAAPREGGERSERAPRAPRAPYSQDRGDAAGYPPRRPYRAGGTSSRPAGQSWSRSGGSSSHAPRSGGDGPRRSSTGSSWSRDGGDKPARKPYRSSATPRRGAGRPRDSFGKEGKFESKW
jgi:ATP-dependent RNA helicase RhlE